MLAEKPEAVQGLHLRDVGQEDFTDDGCEVNPIPMGCLTCPLPNGCKYDDPIGYRKWRRQEDDWEIVELVKWLPVEDVARFKKITVRTVFRAHRRICGTMSLSNRCKNGHDYTPENLVVNQQGHRTCRACKRKKGRELWQRQKAAGYRKPRSGRPVGRPRKERHG